MFNEKSFTAVELNYFEPGFVKPRHEDYCFWRIPGTIHNLLTGTNDFAALPSDSIPSGTKLSKVILVLIDAFGWCFFERYLKDKKYPFLNTLADSALTSKLTSQFPSTTSAHITSLHSATPVGETGVVEWYYYESGLDQVICPFTFNDVTDTHSDVLLKQGVKTEDVFPRINLYKSLVSHGVQPIIPLPHNFKGAYNNYFLKGTESIYYSKHEEGLTSLVKEIQKYDKAYAYYYFPEFDSAVHDDGPFSKKSEKLLVDIFDQIEKYLWPYVQENEDVALILTADHGASSMDPETTVYIDKECPEIIESLKTFKSGSPIAPCGSPRDYFLHVRDGCIDEVFTILSKKFEGHSSVFKISDLIKENFFSNQNVSQKFVDNVGDIAIVSYPGNSLYWLGENAEYKQKFKGHHGGLTREEMETIFLFSRGSNS